jgi:hypothetical protein
MPDVGTTKVAGRRLHHLRIPDVEWRRLSRSLLGENGEGVRINRLGYDVFVTKQGLPQVTRLGVDGTVIQAGFEVDVTFDFEYRFSRFGQRVRIDAPPVSHSGASS